MDLTIDEILDRIDIVDYISQYTDVEDRGNDYWALSPLTSEDTPSFHIDRDRAIFYDFSSGKSGNVISFIQAYEHCGIKDAIEKAKEYISCGEQAGNGRPQKICACRVAKNFAKKPVDKTVTAKPLPDDYMNVYESPGHKADCWRHEGISDESMERFQVRFDSINNRLVFPIRDIDGRIINISGRTMDPDWKQKGLRKYTYYRKFGALTTIYGYAENKSNYVDSGEIILFEGAKSVMIADSWGIKNTGAVLTSHLNRAQMKVLVKLGCRVVFALDKEIDVREDKSIQTLKHYVPVEYIHDTGELLEPKMSPVDAGRREWSVLYQGRRRL